MRSAVAASRNLTRTLDSREGFRAFSCSTRSLDRSLVLPSHPSLARRHQPRGVVSLDPRRNNGGNNALIVRGVRREPRTARRISMAVKNFASQGEFSGFFKLLFVFSCRLSIFFNPRPRKGMKLFRSLSSTPFSLSLFFSFIFVRDYEGGVRFSFFSRGAPPAAGNCPGEATRDTASNPSKRWRRDAVFFFAAGEGGGKVEAARRAMDVLWVVHVEFGVG